jgi:hypothetical protein
MLRTLIGGLDIDLAPSGNAVPSMDNSDVARTVRDSSFMFSYAVGVNQGWWC